MKPLTLKEKFWWWYVFDVIKHPEGEVYSLHLKIFFTILFPIKAIRYTGETKEGYQWLEDTWLINGMRYSGVLFRHFAYGDDCWYKVIKREDGVVTIERKKFVGGDNLPGK